MRRIRTKIILIFVVIVLLPVIPIIWLVNDLVNQSYRVGVNPQVEEALKKAVEFSRELYQTRKLHLSQTLSRLADSSLFQEGQNASFSSDDLALPPPSESGEWQFLSLQMYDSRGKLLAQKIREGIRPDMLNASHFAQLEDTGEKKIVIARRETNRFIAIEKRAGPEFKGYIALTGAMNDDFLAQIDRNLSVYQMYRTLSLSPVSIPRSFLYTFLLISFIILLITIGVGVWLSRKLTEPLGELVKGTEAVGGGNLDYRVQPRSRDEIGELVRHFNRMAGALKTFQEKTIYLEKMAAWQEISRRLAHEIKNPLTPIQLTVQEMVDQYQGKDREYEKLLRECYDIMNEEFENLRHLVQEFSDFGRLPELQMIESDPHELIREVQRLYPRRNIHLELAENIPALRMDEDRIRRVLINLIENAVQADPDNQPITIRTHLREDTFEIAVSDRGSGIEPEVLEKIFQPYYSTKSNGIGLGLAITRKMVEEHDGSIRIETEPGKGSTFTVNLPFGEKSQKASANKYKEKNTQKTL